MQVIDKKVESESPLRFTVLGHACLLLEYKDIRLLTDPWLIGSCYWRSWWNYPETNQDIIRTINPTHIYISHLHWDHYHGPTLRKFYKYDPTILMPKAATSRMLDDMEKDFKFSKILELEHGKEYSLTNNFRIRSYQFNPFAVDSSLAICAGGTKLLNANDSKVFGLSLKQIVSQYKYFDFVFRSHSSASPNPYCVEGVNPYKTSRSPEDYTKDFIAFSEACKAKFAIPFASSHVYLHKGSKKFNQFYNNPLQVLNGYMKYKHKSKCIIMPAMSSWSSVDGFKINSHNFDSIDEHIETMTNSHAAALEREYAMIDKAEVNLIALERYFKKFLSSLPWFYINFKFGFFLTTNLDDLNANGCLVVVNSKNKRQLTFKNSNYKTLINDNEYNLAFIIRTYPNVINDCAKKYMFNTFTPSKLLRIHSFEKRFTYGTFFNLIDSYENDTYPIRNLLRKRQIMNRIARWREFIDIFYMIYITKIRKFPIYRLWHRLREI